MRMQCKSPLKCNRNFKQALACVAGSSARIPRQKRDHFLSIFENNPCLLLQLYFSYQSTARNKLSTRVIECE